MLSEISQTKTNTSTLRNKTNRYITKQKQTHRYREQTSGYQWGEEGGGAR